jgi:hypothetical protein
VTGGHDGGPSTAEIGAYCRSVEAHLTRANAGHLVRIVGPAFELVRGWAIEGVPLSVVCRAIDDKAERHREGASTHPLRIEFCDADVRRAFDRWRRAVGVVRAQPDDTAKLSPHLDRVIDRLTRVGGRMEIPDAVREIANAWLPEAVALREQARGARGARKDAVIARLAPIDREVLDAVRAAVPAGLIDELRQEAGRELAPYRSRIPAGDWTRVTELTVDRLLRERFGLPTFTHE